MNNPATESLVCINQRGELAERIIEELKEAEVMDTLNGIRQSHKVLRKIEQGKLRYAVYLTYLLAGLSIIIAFVKGVDGLPLWALVLISAIVLCRLSLFASRLRSREAGTILAFLTVIAFALLVVTLLTKDTPRNLVFVFFSGVFVFAVLLAIHYKLDMHFRLQPFNEGAPQSHSKSDEFASTLKGHKKLVSSLATRQRKLQAVIGSLPSVEALSSAQLNDVHREILKVQGSILHVTSKILEFYDLSYEGYQGKDCYRVSVFAGHTVALDWVCLGLWVGLLLYYYRS